MESNQKKRQIGSIVNFIIIGVILVLGLIGAAYSLKLYRDNTKKEETAPLVEDKPTNTEPVKPESTKIEVESEIKATVENNIPADLPQTGIASDLVETFGLFLLTASIVSYFISRRNLSIFDL